MRNLYVISIILLALSPTLWADDVCGPQWRGATGSTYQDWRFDTSAVIATPEVSHNPFGTASATIQLGRYSSGWLSQLTGLGTKKGFWDLGSNGTISLSIPNQLQPGSKFVLLQVTCFKDITQPPAVGVSGANKVQEQETVVESVSTGGWWVVEESLWHIPQGLTSEAVTIASSVQWGSVIDEIIADTVYATACDSIAQAKTLPDGTLVELSGPVVTRKFETFFYMEDASRIAGIRVNCPVSQLAAESTAPVVIGTLTTINGERVIDQATVFAGPVRTMPKPLAMNLRATTTGLVPIGILVRLSGRATVTGPSATSFVIDDGSQPVTVELHGVQPPVNGSYISLTGILGTDNAVSVLRINTNSAMRSW